MNPNNSLKKNKKTLFFFIPLLAVIAWMLTFPATVSNAQAPTGNLSTLQNKQGSAGDSSKVIPIQSKADNSPGCAFDTGGHLPSGCFTPTDTDTPTDTPTDIPTNTPTDTPTSASTATSTPCPFGSGYMITNSTGSIVAGTTDIGNHCDDCNTTITLPFSITLYDTTYTTAAAGSNGYLAFGILYDSFYSGCLPNASFTYTIFPFETDQITDQTGNYGIFTLTAGASPNRTFYVEWRNCRYSSTGCLANSDNNYEIVFQEGQTSFQVVYGVFGSANATAGAIGVEKNSTFYTQSQCNAGAPASLAQTYSVGCLQPTSTRTNTSTRTATRTITLTRTRTNTPTITPTITLTSIPTDTPTYTNTPIPTDTPMDTPTGTFTRTHTPTVTSTFTKTTTPTVTNTPTITNTYTSTPTFTNTPLPCASVVWTNIVNVTATGNSIQKRSGAGSTWDAGASSAQYLASGNGYVEATVDSTSTYRMFGLSNGDTDVSYGDIDFAAYLAGNTLKVYENGVNKGSFGTLNVGDVVRVAVTTSTVRYYLNGVLVYTSTGTPSYPLLVDTAINSYLGTIQNVALCGANIGGNPTNTPTSTFTITPTFTRTPTSTSTSTSTFTVTSTFTRTPTFTPTPIPTTCESVVFNDTANVTVTGNSMRKTGGAGSTWDAGAVSAQSLVSGQGSVQATVDSVQTYRMFGLSHGNHNANFTDINYAAYLAAGVLKVYESGSYKGSFGTLVVGDTVMVAVNDGVVRYYLNGVLQYTSATAPTYPLNLDTSINSLGGSLTNLVICGANMISDPTFTPTATNTTVPTNTRTSTNTPLPTNTPTATNTPLPTNTPTSTNTRVPNTNTSTATRTNTNTPVPAPTWACNPVTWINLVNVTATGNTIRKTGGASGAWDAGATSSQLITSGDGYVQASVVETNTYAMFGLDQSGTTTSASDTDFALFTAGGTLKVYESGVLRGNFGNYAINDVLKVASVGGIVRYWRNDVLLYTSAVAPRYPLQMNTAINSIGGRIANAYICPQPATGPESYQKLDPKP